MDTSRQIERATAEALLDVGVSVPILTLRLPWRKEPWTLRLTMRRPYLGGMVRIAREYTAMEVNAEELEAMTQKEQMAFLATHGKRLSRIVALTICRGEASGRIATPFVSWLLRSYTDPALLVACFTRFVALLGIGDFGTIIRLCEALNPMRPTHLSQEKRGS